MIPKLFRSAESLAAARRILFAGMSLLCVVPAFSQKVHDAIRPLPAGAVRLDGFFENDIRNSIDHWNKGVVPYAAMVDFFRNGRSQFALGEMWGKAVRSGCMFYRYTADPELKEILSQTVKDLLSTVRPNGSISCVPPEKQPDGPGGDLWERKYVLLGLDRYYDLGDDRSGRLHHRASGRAAQSADHVAGLESEPYRVEHAARTVHASLQPHGRKALPRFCPLYRLDRRLRRIRYFPSGI